MELWEQLLCHAVMNGKVEIKLEKGFDLNTLLENKCYNALMQIKRILSDDRLDNDNRKSKFEAFRRQIYDLPANFIMKFVDFVAMI